MSISPKLPFAITALGISCLFAGYVVAQQQVGDRKNTTFDQPAAQNPAIGNQPGQADAQREGQIDRNTPQSREYTTNFRGNPQNAAGQNQDVQRYIAGCLLSKNQAEVEIAEFAQQQAQTPEVKEFAQKMVQDHGKLIQDLHKVSSNVSTNRADSDAATTRDTTGQNAVDQIATNRATNANSAVDQLLAMDRQITERCTQAAREELQQKQGVEFDKCYIGSQINGHVHMLAALEVIQQQGPEQLQQIAKQAHPQVQKHLEHAKQIMKQLDGDAAATASRGTQAQPQR